jgi:hypothetical protein
MVEGVDVAVAEAAGISDLVAEVDGHLVHEAEGAAACCFGETNGVRVELAERGGRVGCANSVKWAIFLISGHRLVRHGVAGLESDACSFRAHTLGAFKGSRARANTSDRLGMQVRLSHRLAHSLRSPSG